MLGFLKRLGERREGEAQDLLVIAAVRGKAERAGDNQDQPYYELPGLDTIYLEDSYVLGVQESETALRFDLDAVLTENHSKYSPPKKDEYYCFLRVTLVFPGLRRVEWVKRTMRPYGDATGEVDYGNIHTFIWDGTQYDLEGDWGRVRIESDRPLLTER
jgi:hypothetical protein